VTAIGGELDLDAPVGDTLDRVLTVLRSLLAFESVPPW